ncbi:hypothetical protein Tco_0261551 [Tanacetum coccineum]
MGVPLSGSQGLSSPEQTPTGKDTSNLFMAVMTCQKLASPRVNGYLVKASSNPFTFYDSPLPRVNTPWDVMRISLNLVAAVFAAVSILNAFKTEDLSSLGNWKYVVPTGRVIATVIATVSIKVPTGRYIVPAGYIVPTGRTN